MFCFQINTQCNIDIICEYVYKNREFLKDNKCDKILYINKIKTEDLKVCIGFGEYCYLYKNHEIFINYKEEGNTKGTDRGVEYYKRFTLCCIKENIILEFLKDCYNYIKNINEENTNILITDKYGEWINYNKLPSRTLESIYIDNSIKNKIVKDIEVFLESEKDYNNFGIPYKRTYLLTGIPGSGKTSLIKALCKKFNYSLSMLSISNNFDNSSLLVAIKELPKKTIFLIEDIDSLFEKRNFSTDNNSLTFSNFINILDGILYRHSTIIFLTTNHPEKLDHALLRIGRIDMIIKFDYPSRNNIEKLFNDLLKNIYNEKELKDNFNSFYDLIKDKKIAMSAIINFLFRYKDTWNIYIKELLDTNNFIRETLKQNKTENMYN